MQIEYYSLPASDTHEALLKGGERLNQKTRGGSYERGTLVVPQVPLNNNFDRLNWHGYILQDRSLSRQNFLEPLSYLPILLYTPWWLAPCSYRNADFLYTPYIPPSFLSSSLSYQPYALNLSSSSNYMALTAIYLTIIHSQSHTVNYTPLYSLFIHPSENNEKCELI